MTRLISIGFAGVIIFLSSAHGADKEKVDNPAKFNVIDHRGMICYGVYRYPGLDKGRGDAFVTPTGQVILFGGDYTAVQDRGGQYVDDLVVYPK